jgi:hypothetical protein
MAKGRNIILTGEPLGLFEEGYITDTSKPGMIMETVPGAALVNGRRQVRAASRAAGTKGPLCVLLADSLQSKLGVGAAGASVTSGGVTVTGAAQAGDAYAAGTVCFLYWPEVGDELNLLVGDVAGTGDVLAVGDLYGVNNNGKLIKNASYASAPFECQEGVGAITGDGMVWFKLLGTQA